MDTTVYFSEINSEEMEIPTIEERIQVDYNSFELRKICRNKTKWTLGIEQMEDELNEDKDKPVYLFYSNHEEVSLKTIQSFRDNKIVYQIIIGLTQSGKTAGMLCIINDYVKNNIIDPDNIYLITGLSSTNWVEQTKLRMPENLRKNIYHNGQLKDFKKSVEEKKNILLLIDEAHMASKDKQTISSMFNELGWNLDYLLKNDIKIISMSATPDGLVFAMNKWPQSNYAFHIMHPGNGYYGTKEMMEKGKLLEAKELAAEIDDDDDEKNTYIISHDTELHWREIIKNHLTFNSPKYLIIRMKSPFDIDSYTIPLIEVLESTFSQYQHLFSTKYEEYSMNGTIDDLNSFLENAPSKHKIIFIKSKLTCAQTLIKTNIGSMVDRPTKNNSFSVQSFPGRACGYQEHDIFIYTNIQAIETYHEMWDKEFINISNLKWKSNTTKTSSGKTVSKLTYASPEILCPDRIDIDRSDTKSIPVKLLFNDEEYRKKLFDIIDKIIFNTMICQGIIENKITVDDKNIIKFQSRETIYSIRKYTFQHNPSSRRFKAFHNAYTNNEKYSQTCTKGSYCIDIACDEYDYDNYLNPVNIGWITFV